MTKLVDDSVLDAALNVVTAGATAMHVCSGDPTTRAAVLTNSLATVTPTYTGPVNGDTSGRKITSDQKTGVSVTATGTAGVVCHIDATDLLYKTDESTGQTLTSGNTCTIPAHDIEIADPT